LTHLLENALGGNANIAVICTLSLEERHQAETLETLKFASRCAQVQTKAVQGIVSRSWTEQEGRILCSATPSCFHQVASSEKGMLIAKEEEIAALRLQLEEMVRQRPTDLSEVEEVDSRAEVSLSLS
jgi:centromeric protein E